MNTTLRLTLSFLIVISFAGLTMADERLKIADLASDPTGFAGRSDEGWCGGFFL